MIDTIIEEMSEKIKIRENVLDSSAGENSSTQILASNTVFHEGKTYHIHPIYHNYAASKDGYIINRKRLKARKGQMMASGYFNLNMNNKKCYTSHRFVYEAVNQQIIPDGYQIHHINNDKQDNSIENLALVTRQQNMIYKGNECKGMKYKSTQNVEIKCDVFNYHPIYTNFGANKYGQIFNKKTKRCSIGCIHTSGYMAKRLSQIGLPCKQYFIHRLVYECIKGEIPDGMQINHINSNKQDNCIDNLEVVTHSENMKHAHEAKKYKTLIEITSDKPIEKIKWDIKMKESDDDFTEDEKQLIDQKYKTLMTYIKNNQFPYKKQLQQHFPGMEFW